MNNVEYELRRLMSLYDERLKRLQRELKEAKEDKDWQAVGVNEVLQRQCRIMIAELFVTMKVLGVLDEEERKYGAINKFNQ